MQHYKLYLKEGKEKSLYRRHPWVFSGAVKKIEGKPTAGDLVDIYDCQKQYLATGHFQNESIIVKILSFDSPNIDYAFWKERFEQALNYRKRFYNLLRLLGFRLLENAIYPFPFILSPILGLNFSIKSFISKMPQVPTCIIFGSKKPFLKAISTSPNVFVISPGIKSCSSTRASAVIILIIMPL